MRWLLSVLIALGIGSGQADGQAQQAQPSRQQRPTRDTAGQQIVRPPGTALIVGHVLAGDTGRPLSRARLLLSSSDLPDSLAVLTDSEGRFAFTALPAGSFSITASKSGFVPIEYGATRPQRPGKRITVSQGQQVSNVLIRLPRGSVLTGHLYDETGEPVVNGQVRALRFQYQQGERRAVPVGTGRTDDRGQFRIWDLLPGTYLVSASVMTERRPPDERPDPSFALTYAPVYYPGIAAAADASPVVVGVQQEVGGIDFAMQLVPTARVSGAVVGDSSAGGASMVVLVTDEGRAVAGITDTYSARVNPDGTFVVQGVAPGRYLAIARSMGPQGPGGRGGPSARSTPLMGQQAVSVAGQDVPGVTITLGTGGTVSGSVVSESTTSTREDLSQVRVVTRPLGTNIFGGGNNPGPVQADGTFSVQGVAVGPNLLAVQGVRTPWSVKGIYLNGREISDTPLEIRNGQAVSGVQVVLTDRPTEVTGTVVDGEQQPVPDCYVVAFAADAGLWQPLTRAIQGVKPDAKGNYRIAGLPPGNYLVVATADVEPGAWYDPSLLEGWRSIATTVAVAEGESRTVSLKLADQ